MKCKSLWNGILEFFYPPRCLFCRKIVLPGRECCEACEKSLLSEHWSARMIEPQTGKTLVCIAPDQYDGPLRKAMLDFKFHNMPKHAHFFAQRIFSQLQQSSFLTRADFVVSVPLSRERLHQRGYNQSELIARELAALAGLPYFTVLEKHVENQEQHRLHKKDRRQNVRGVYRILPGAHQVENQRILLVDDILTTGATLGECAAVLYAAGAKEVLCAAACRVPTQPESISC